MDKKEKEMQPKAFKLGDERFLLAAIKCWRIVPVRRNDKGIANQYVAYRVEITHTKGVASKLFVSQKEAEEVIGKLDNYFGIL